MDMIHFDTVRAEVARELSIEGLPEAEQEKILVLVAQNVLEALMLAIFRKLPPEVQPSFTAAIEAGNPAEIEALMQTHIPRSEAFVKNIIKTEITELKRRQQELLQQKS